MPSASSDADGSRFDTTAIARSLGERLAFELRARVEALPKLANEASNEVATGRPPEGLVAEVRALASKHLGLSRRATTHFATTLTRALQGSVPHSRSEGADAARLITDVGKSSEVKGMLEQIDDLSRLIADRAGLRRPEPSLTELYKRSQRVHTSIETMAEIWQERRIADDIVAIGAELRLRAADHELATDRSPDTLDPARSSIPIEPGTAHVVTHVAARAFGPGATTVDVCFSAIENLLEAAVERGPTTASAADVYIASSMLQPSSPALSGRQRRRLEELISDLLASDWNVHHKIATSPDRWSPSGPPIAALIADVLIRKVGRRTNYFPYVAPPKGNEVVAVSGVGAVWMTRPSADASRDTTAALTPGLAVTALVSDSSTSTQSYTGEELRSITSEALRVAAGDRDSDQVSRLFEYRSLPEGFYFPTNDVLEFDRSLSAVEFWPGDRLAVKTHPMVSTLSPEESAQQFEWWREQLTQGIVEGVENRFARFARLANVDEDQWDDFIRFGGTRPDPPTVAIDLIDTSGTGSKDPLRRLHRPTKPQRRMLMAKVDARLEQLAQTRLARHHAFRMNISSWRYRDVVEHSAIRSYLQADQIEANPLYGPGGLSLATRRAHVERLLGLMERPNDPDTGYRMAIPSSAEIRDLIDVDQTWVVVTTDPEGQSSQAHFLLENRDGPHPGGRLVGWLSPHAARELDGAKALAAKFHLVWDEIGSTDRNPTKVTAQLRRYMRD